VNRVLQHAVALYVTACAAALSVLALVEVIR
jgi:hypothetical protein